ncbi:hypothetical protein SAMN05660350_02779 [Geodermatophilus obscurus]|uniref:ATP synthase protein I n=1 Tax=Geodermatophilus obscurus TaxID=1861 RepID=A0A1M7U8M4_9ACTN|nr:hypothetical protein [Geodermatophilus obscurus]SHN79391.1 hypothetical protein SAMN05660350_02779 [Geodermatophilus obscurus]
MSTGPSRPEAPWDLSFLRVGAVVTAGVAAVAASVTGLLAGWDDAIGVLVGAVVVTAFFVVSGVVVAWAGRIDDSFTLPAALGAFFVKALLLFAVLNALPENGWLDRRTLAWAVVVGALLWSGVQLRWVWTRPLYYVTPPPPPPTGGSARPRGGPATRG